MIPSFDLQGHRGARGLKPENTLPGFEVAFDLGVTSIETDVHLTRDGVPVLFHDAVLTDRLCRPAPPGPVPVRTLTLAELRGYRVDRNPDPRRFPAQDASVTPLAGRFAAEHGMDPYAVPTLDDLFAFAAAYAGEMGAAAGKSPEQRARVAEDVRFDLELKRVPFRPEHADECIPGVLEQRVVEAVQRAGLVQRTSVRSFDHRSVRAVRGLEPGLRTAVLLAGTAPIAPAALVRRARADIYCPEYEFLDETLVRHCHRHGVRVLPWTVNDPADMLRLLEWGVDGITTDFPDRLAALWNQEHRKRC
jgi:glycerophosphoryl diester phosphodiesterase